MTLCHIVPSIPPEFNGLGDYCYQLWKHWPEPASWEILTTRIPDGAREHWPGAKIESFERSAEGLSAKLSVIGARTVVLHYVGYAYAKRGAPVWLPRVLSDWKRRTGGRLVVMFHELFATGPPWSSAFWLLPAQMGVAQMLASVADRWITSCPSYMRSLERYLRAEMSKGTMIPIGSTIDPVAEPAWGRAWPTEHGGKLKIVNFGMPVTRLRTLRVHRNLLKSLVDHGLVENVLLTGKSDSPGAVLDETNVTLQAAGCANLTTRAFDLSTPELSRLLLDQHLGLIHNPYATLTKSTVYAAYCTHGLLSVVPPERGTQPGPYVINDDSKPEACVLEIESSHWKPSREERASLLFETISEKFAAVCEAVRPT